MNLVVKGIVCPFPQNVCCQNITLINFVLEDWQAKWSDMQGSKFTFSAPKGMEPYDLRTENDLGALNDEQQQKLNQFKVRTQTHSVEAHVCSSIPRHLKCDMSHLLVQLDVPFPDKDAFGERKVSSQSPRGGMPDHWIYAVRGNEREHTQFLCDKSCIFLRESSNENGIFMLHAIFREVLMERPENILNFASGRCTQHTHVRA